MKKKILLAVIISAVILSGCKSLFTREGNLLSDAAGAKSRGDYQAAVLNAAESVRIDNVYADAINFLQETYPEANSYYLQKIEERKSAGSQYNNDKIVTYLEYLQDINESVRTLPALYDPKTKAQVNFSYTDYQAELDRYEELAAEDHYKEGLRLMALKGRENFRNASREFEEALGYSAGYKDAERRAQKALEDATQIVAFFPFQNNAWNIPTEKFSDLIQNAAISRLLSDKEVMKFTKIIDREMQENLMDEQIESLSSLMDDNSRVEIGNLLNSNIFLTGSIESSELIGPSTTMNQYHRKKTIEIVQEISNGKYQKDGTLTDPTAETVTEIVYQDVYADVYHYTKFLRFNVTVTYKAVDVETGAIMLSNTVNIDEVDSSEWAEWSGDSDALTSDDWNLINSYETAVQTPQQIASTAARSIGETLADELKTILK
jgi:hypothetical protein